METRLRLATAQDTAAVFHFMQEYYNEVKLPNHPKKNRWAVERMLANPAVGCVWLITFGHDVVGYMVMSLGYALEVAVRDAFFDDIYVVPQARRRGIARMAVQLALGEATRLAVHAVHIEVDPGDDKGRHMYRQLGFRDRDLSHLMTFPLEGA